MKIAAASCCKLQHFSSQPVWDEIRAEQPDALILLGDNVYLDHDFHSDPAKLELELRRLYAQQKAEPHFAALLNDMAQRGKPVMAIYDDHDFLGNDRFGGGEDLALCEAARRELVTAFSPMQTGDDVYSQRRIGPVEVIVLDARFYRRKITDSLFDRDAMLGANQWAWFEKAVADTKAPFVLVVSSTTAYSYGLVEDAWERCPAAFKRLCELLGKRRGALVVSGDVHSNDRYDDAGLVEIVTSGVARRGLVFGKPRANYALLEFGAQSLRVEQRGLKSSDRWIGVLPLNNWQLP
jgi:alkaline phosphatase D